LADEGWGVDKRWEVDGRTNDGEVGGQKMERLADKRWEVGGQRRDSGAGRRRVESPFCFTMVGEGGEENMANADEKNVDLSLWFILSSLLVRCGCYGVVVLVLER